MIFEIIKAVIEFSAVVLMIVAYKNEDKFIKFEISLKRRIAEKLRSSERFMNWLYEPSISEQTEADYCAGKVKICNDWRSEKHG